MRVVLVVEDDKTIREMITVLLSGEGFEVLEAEDGDTALTLAYTHQPDLIISDVQIDNINGFMLREFLRDDVRTSAIPLLLITGESQHAAAWMADPTIGYLAKPFSKFELFQAIEERLESATRTSQRQS